MKLINNVKKIKYEIIVFLITFTSRLPLLGMAFINDDAARWKVRAYSFGEAFFSLNPAGTLVTYHPGVPLTWIMVLGIKAFSFFNIIYYKGNLSEYQLVVITHVFQKLSVVFFSSILFVCLFVLLKKIFSAKLSLVAILLLFFEPFFFYLSKALHNDVLLTLFMALALVSFFLVFREGRYSFKNKYAIYSGIWLGLAALTKSAALFLIPFFILWFVIEYIQSKNKNSWKVLLTVFVVSLLIFIVVWPAMWVIPQEALSWYFGKGIERTALTDGHIHNWFGVKTMNPGIWFYPVMIIAKFSPSFILISFYGVYKYISEFKTIDKLKIFFRKKSFPKLTKEGLMGMIFYGYSFGFFLMITIVPKKLDRYELPLMFPLLIIGLYYMFKYLRKEMLWIVVFVYFFINISTLIILHPDYNAYYSPFIGGLNGGKDLLESTWTVGAYEVGERFNELSIKDGRKLNIAFADYGNLAMFAKNFKVMNINNPSERDAAEYFVLPVYSRKRNVYYKSEYFLTREYDLDIYVGPTLYYEVYKVEGKKQI